MRIDINGALWFCKWFTVGVLIFAFILCIMAVPAYFEASAYNRATGKHVSTWDAMWIELRVTGDPK